MRNEISINLDLAQKVFAYLYRNNPSLASEFFKGTRPALDGPRREVIPSLRSKIHIQTVPTGTAMPFQIWCECASPEDTSKVASEMLAGTFDVERASLLCNALINYLGDF